MPSIWNVIINAPRLIGCMTLQWFTENAPLQRGSLDGKLAVITGGNRGIGFETAKGLVVRGCEVIILCRDVDKAVEAVEKINSSSKAAGSSGKCSASELDLADLGSVSKCAAALKTLLSSRKIDFFVCNGGIMLQPYSVSPQGHELHFATNHLGHFALVGLLLDLLRASQSRVVVVTGDICVLESDASPDYKYEETNPGGLLAYCRSKICGQSFAFELHRRYPELYVTLVHPGVVYSGLVPHATGVGGTIEKLLQLTEERGAQPLLICCVTDKVPCGAYYHNVYGVCRANPTAYDSEWSKNMWELSKKLAVEGGATQLKF